MTRLLETLTEHVLYFTAILSRFGTSFLYFAVVVHYILQVDKDWHWNLVFLCPFTSLGQGVGLRTSPFKDVDRLQSFLLIKLAAYRHIPKELILELQQRLLIRYATPSLLII